MNKIKIIGTALLGLICSSVTFSQSENSAIRLASQPNNNTGSARYQAMSGSMGAMGAEYSAVNINPAGLGLFRSNKKITFTLSGDNRFNRSKWYSTSTYDKSGIGLNFDEVSFMASLKKSDNIGFSFGFGVQRGASFSRDISIKGNMNGKGTSFADYVGASINRFIYGNDFDIPDSLFINIDAYDVYPWMMVLGARNKWVISDGGTGKLYHSNFRPSNTSQVKGYTAAEMTSLNLHEEGGIMKYNFAGAFEVDRRLHIGFVVNLSWLDYKLSSGIYEQHKASTNDIPEYLDFGNSITIKGRGLDFGLGIIAEPINNLRLGAAIFSPTYYNFNQSFYANASSVVNADSVINEISTPSDGFNTFAMSTPWRFTLSGAYIFGRRAIINVDYEASILGSTRLYDRTEDYTQDNTNSYLIDNNAMKEDYNIRNTIKVGAEINLTNRFALRSGLSYTSSGINSKLFDKDMPTRDFLTDNLSPIYTAVDNIKGISLGFGYKITPNWSLDVSCLDNITSSRVYAFPVINDPASKWIGGANAQETFLEGYEPVKVNTHLFNVAATVSYRF